MNTVLLVFLVEVHLFFEDIQKRHSPLIYILHREAE